MTQEIRVTQMLLPARVLSQHFRHSSTPAFLKMKMPGSPKRRRPHSYFVAKTIVPTFLKACPSYMSHSSEQAYRRNCTSFQVSATVLVCAIPIMDRSQVGSICSMDG